MAHKYKIRIHDIHEYEVDKAETTFYVFGELLFEEDGYRIVYEEMAGDLAGCTTTICCSNDREVTVHREGPFQTDLSMEPGRRHHCFYRTEFGDMLIGVYAEAVESDMTERGGDLSFTYNIDYNGDFVSRNILHITVKETF